MGIEQRIGELVNLQDGRWMFMPSDFFLEHINIYTFTPFLSYLPYPPYPPPTHSKLNSVIQWHTTQQVIS